MPMLKTNSLFLSFLVVALAIFSSAPANAQKINVTQEAQIAASVCVDQILNGKDNFDTLLARGFEIKMKRRSWDYNKRMRKGLIPGRGVTITTPPYRGVKHSTIFMVGISSKNANAIYKGMQQKLYAAGFRRKTERRGIFFDQFYVKGSERIVLDGSNGSNLGQPSASIQIYRK